MISKVNINNAGLWVIHIIVSTWCLLLLKTGNDQQRLLAAYALGRWGAKGNTKPLIKALNDKYDRVRSAAVLSLGKLGDKRAIEPLIGCLNDPEARIRYFAYQVLGEIGDIRALPALQVIRDNDPGDASWNLRQVAAAAIWRIQSNI